MNEQVFELTKRVAFIGRKSELAQIDKAVRQGNETVVVNIVGDGGMGKTTLLNYVREVYKAQPDLLATKVIDFSQTSHRVQGWVMMQITEMGESHFTKTKKKLERLENLSPQIRQYREHEAIEAFVAEYNQLAQHYRILLLFDTIELVLGTPLLTFILDVVKQLHNTVLILAGRPTPQSSRRLFAQGQNLDNLLQDRFSPENTVSLELEGFLEQEAQEYFEKAVPDLLVNPDLQTNLFLLSAGNPIKIALALDWLRKHIPLMPEITQWQPEELRNLDEAELGRRRQKFDQALMRGIDELEGDLNEVILYMAHLHKRFNQDMLAYFFPDSAPALLKKLSQLPFVKYISEDYFVLHDEMARLVQTHIWDALADPDKSQRRQLSREALTYYDQALEGLPPIEERNEEEKILYWAYRVERVYYSLYAKFEQGYREFEEVWETLAQANRAELAALAVNFLQEFEDEPEYSKLLACFVNGYYRGGVLLAHQQFEDAEKMLVQGRKKVVEELKNFDPKRASETDRHLKQHQYKVYHQLGYCYRSLGRWQDAIDNYKQSLDDALAVFETLDTPAEQTSLMQQGGETLNSLANVHRLEGNLYEAGLLCQTGIFVREAWDQENLSGSRYVMAMILWESGHTAEAVTQLQKAKDACKPENDGMKARIQKYRAYIFFRTGQSADAIPLLQDMETIFERLGLYSEQADALNLLSRIYRDSPEALSESSPEQNPLTLAKMYADQAYDIARKIGDKFLLTECHLTQSLYYYHTSQTTAENQKLTYRQEALEHCEQGIKLAERRYYQLSSLYHQVRGDLAFTQMEPNYEVAFDAYFEQCVLATRFKRAVYERSMDHVGSRLRDLGTRSPKKAQHYLRNIIHKWQEQEHLENQCPLAEAYPELIRELEEIERTIEEQLNLNTLEQQYQQAMLEGKWNEAAQICNEQLNIPSLYDNVSRAQVILKKADATYHAGALSEARRLLNVVLQITQNAQAPILRGQAHLLLAQVLWDTTSTAEAAKSLTQAEQIFKAQQSQMNSAKAARQRNYVLYRTGRFEEAWKGMATIAPVFEEADAEAELADVWNIMSRIARTRTDKADIELAHKYARDALEKAKDSNNAYRIAECYLSLIIETYRRKEYEDVLELCEEGLSYLPSGTYILRNVYAGIRGAALFSLGQNTSQVQVKMDYWDQAFQSFAQEILYAYRGKPASFVRALWLTYGYLIQLPQEFVRQYTAYLKGYFSGPGPNLADIGPIVERMCTLIEQYCAYFNIKPVDNTKEE